jgi:Restriction endonuclease
MGMAESPDPEWGSYEQLTEGLMRQIGAVDRIETVRLERDVVLAGLATENQIDVVWEFKSESGQLVRLLFECRRHGRRITQQALHSWRSVVADVSETGVETIGVMVTTTGYQAGAQRVADTYGIVICELRAPTDEDLAGRIWSVRVQMIPRLPTVTDLDVKATEQLGAAASFDGALGEFSVELADGTISALGDELLRGELDPLDQPPTPRHGVTRTYDPPVMLRRVEESIAKVWQISATVGEVESDPTTIESQTGRIAWMLANTLTGSHTWFAEDGRIWRTPS